MWCWQHVLRPPSEFTARRAAAAAAAPVEPDRPLPLESPLREMVVTQALLESAEQDPGDDRPLSPSGWTSKPATVNSKQLALAVTLLFFTHWVSPGYQMLGGEQRGPGTNEPPRTTKLFGAGWQTDLMRWPDVGRPQYGRRVHAIVVAFWDLVTPLILRACRGQLKPGDVLFLRSFKLLTYMPWLGQQLIHLDDLHRSCLVVVVFLTPGARTQFMRTLQAWDDLLASGFAERYAADDQLPTADVVALRFWLRELLDHGLDEPEQVEAGSLLIFRSAALHAAPLHNLLNTVRGALFALVEIHPQSPVGGPPVPVYKHDPEQQVFLFSLIGKAFPEPRVHSAAYSSIGHRAITAMDAVSPDTSAWVHAQSHGANPCYTPGGLMDNANGWLSKLPWCEWSGPGDARWPVSWNEDIGALLSDDDAWASGPRGQPRLLAYDASADAVGRMLGVRAGEHPAVYGPKTSQTPAKLRDLVWRVANGILTQSGMWVGSVGVRVFTVRLYSHLSALRPHIDDACQGSFLLTLTFVINNIAGTEAARRLHAGTCPYYEVTLSCTGKRDRTIRIAPGEAYVLFGAGRWVHTHAVTPPQSCDGVTRRTIVLGVLLPGCPDTPRGLAAVSAFHDRKTNQDKPNTP